MLWVQEGLFSCEKKYHHVFEMRDQYYFPKTHFSQYSELEILGINKNSKEKKIFFLGNMGGVTFLHLIGTSEYAAFLHLYLIGTSESAVGEQGWQSRRCNLAKETRRKDKNYPEPSNCQRSLWMIKDSLSNKFFWHGVCVHLTVID
jgi:hypothetical protein